MAPKKAITTAGATAGWCWCCPPLPRRRRRPIRLQKARPWRARQSQQFALAETALASPRPPRVGYAAVMRLTLPSHRAMRLGPVQRRALAILAEAPRQLTFGQLRERYSGRSLACLVTGDLASSLSRALRLLADRRLVSVALVPGRK